MPGLPGGKQQLLAIEPVPGLDPISTLKIDKLIYESMENHAITIVACNRLHSARAPDCAASAHVGKIKMFCNTSTLFTNPGERLTGDHATGRHGRPGQLHRGSKK